VAGAPARRAVLRSEQVAVAEAAVPVAQQEAVAEAAVPVAQQEAVAEAAAPVAQQVAMPAHPASEKAKAGSETARLRPVWRLQAEELLVQGTAGRRPSA